MRGQRTIANWTDSSCNWLADGRCGDMFGMVFCCMWQQQVVLEWYDGALTAGMTSWYIWKLVWRRVQLPAQSLLKNMFAGVLTSWESRFVGRDDPRQRVTQQQEIFSGRLESCSLHQSHDWCCTHCLILSSLFVLGLFSSCFLFCFLLLLNVFWCVCVLSKLFILFFVHCFLLCFVKNIRTTNSNLTIFSLHIWWRSFWARHLRAQQWGSSSWVSSRAWNVIAHHRLSSFERPTRHHLGRGSCICKQWARRQLSRTRQLETQSTSWDHTLNYCWYCAKHRQMHIVNNVSDNVCVPEKQKLREERKNANTNLKHEGQQQQQRQQKQQHQQQQQQQQQSKRGPVLTVEEPPLHSGELNHALSQAGGPTQSQLSRPMSSGNHISMEHRLRRKVKLWYLCKQWNKKKEIEGTRNGKTRDETHDSGVTLKWAIS